MSRGTVCNRLTVLVVLIGELFIAWAAAAALPPAPEGRVRFYNIADSDFDRYSRSPSRAEQQFMREHYARMQTYSPYFDERLSWFPQAWVYKDSYAIKPHWPIFHAHPEWVLRDAAGKLLYIPWGCANGTCPQYAADVGNPAFRANWIAEARRLIERGYRGIWVDDVNLTWRVSDGRGQHVRPIDPRSNAPMRLEDWRRNFADFMEEVRGAFPDIEIAHNAIWYAGSFDDPEILRQIDAADYINLERGATDLGLKGGSGPWSFERFLSFIDLVHRRGRAVILMDYGQSEREREYGLAAWFLISEGRDLISSNQVSWVAPGSFWPGYRLDLGAARGPRFLWRGLLRRDFHCGYVLLNPPGGSTLMLPLPSEQRRIDGSRAASLTLRRSEAAVILHDCQQAAGSAPAPSPDPRVHAEMSHRELTHP